jgi:hypothetical protein
MHKAEKYIEKVRLWLNGDDNVLALALVGSYARKQARPDSDIDFLIICEDITLLEKDISWIDQFGKVKSHNKEHWGTITSVRVFYADGQEVEFGLAPKSWADIPVDAVTRSVVSDGMIILKDINNILGKLKSTISEFRIR